MVFDVLLEGLLGSFVGKLSFAGQLVRLEGCFERAVVQQMGQAKLNHRADAVLGRHQGQCHRIVVCQLATTIVGKVDQLV